MCEFLSSHAYWVKLVGRAQVVVSALLSNCISETDTRHWQSCKQKAAFCTIRTLQPVPCCANDYIRLALLSPRKCQSYVHLLLVRKSSKNRTFNVQPVALA